MELLTAAESEAAQRRIAGGLLRRGLGSGDRVALLTSSSGSMLSAILGALRVGIVPVLLNSGLTPHERDRLLADAAPALIVDDALLASLVEAAPTELAPYPLARAMHYTSGTTGEPKGVWSGVLDETEAAALFREEAELWGFDAADRHLVCSPFHHSVSIRFGGGTLLSGGSVIVLGRFEAQTAVRALAECRPTTTFMVPSHLQRLFAYADDVGSLPDHPDLRLLAHAGSPCPPPLKRRTITEFGVDQVWEFYGSTEGQFTACSSHEWLERPGTVGRARPGRRLFIEPVEDDLAGTQPNGEPGSGPEDVGVIWCEVPAYARFEYWRDPEKTSGAWRTTDQGQAFTVRDLGRLDADGYLFLDGRRDDLIITGGVNVYPAEIENALAAAPGVAEVAVFGVEDERWGQMVCAAVVPSRSGEAPDHDQLRRFAKQVLAGYKVPKRFFLVEDLPRTSTGKVQRNRIVDQLAL
ncbi:MAG: AMP-binding protein [Acidimicrobiales bacterium]|nr:AMP-binding protein [Acidimicrobiales bacterium]